MKNAILTTDIHLKQSNLEITSKLFNLLENKIKELGAENLIITGDINDSKSIIRSESFIQFQEFLQKVDVNIFLLVGNHDMHNTRRPELGHSLELFKVLDKVKVIDKPTLITPDIKFVPYIHDPMELKKEITKDSVKYLFCHNGILGATMNDVGTKDETSISSENFNSIMQVFCGHYHNFHQLGENITYLGSPFSHSFAESNTEKYIAFIDFEKDGVEYIPTNLRKHITIQLDSTVENNLDSLKFSEDDIVRIVISGPKENNLILLEKIEKKGINAKIALKNEAKAKKRLKMDNFTNKSQIIKSYIDNIETKLDKKRLLKIGEEILNAKV